MRKYDVVVVGNGFAGLSCALSLVKHGASVVLCTGGKRRARPSLGEMLHPRAADLVQRSFGTRLPDSSVAVTSKWTAWGEEAGEYDYLFWHAAPAWVVDRKDLTGALSSATRAAGVEFYHSDLPPDVSRDGDNWRLGQDQETLSASFLVEATGVRGRSIAVDGAKCHYLDTLVCRSFVTDLSAGDERKALIAAGAEGWAYSVPVSSAKRLYVWFTDADLLPDCCWSRIEEALGGIHGEVSASPHACATTAARTAIRSKIWDSNWLAIGDAAWTLDPLAGNGIERAINDGASAAKAIVGWLSNGAVTPLREHAIAKVEAFSQARIERRKQYAMGVKGNPGMFWQRRLRT